MMRRFCFYLSGAVAAGALCALAGCGGHNMFAEREPWRHEAELQCINSGAVKEGPGKVRISPIDGPGVCGADFPLKASSLGGDSVPLGYSDDLRPPGAVPNGAGPAPRWPIAPRPAGPIVTRDDLLSDQPLSLDPSGTRERAGAAGETYDFRRPYGAPSGRPGAAASDASSPYDFSPEPYERRQVIGGPKSAPRTVPSPPPPALGAVRGPASTSLASTSLASTSPASTSPASSPI